LLVPTVLAVRFLPGIDPSLAASFGMVSGNHASAAFVTCDQEHSLYVALDEATKHAPVDVVYARSLYAGARYSPGPLAGEIMGVLAGPDPDCVQEGLRACLRCLQDETRYGESRQGGRFFAHTVASLGEYLAARTGVAAGDSLAYLMAPPLEAMIALDAAIKAADVRLVQAFPPPTPTNFAGGFLTGELFACQAAAEAFAAMIEEVSRCPIEALP
jgi:ethanolamine utilization protein EutL